MSYNQVVDWLQGLCGRCAGCLRAGFERAFLGAVRELVLPGGPQPAGRSRRLARILYFIHVLILCSIFCDFLVFSLPLDD